MITALRKYHEYWWTCFPAVPASREDFRYQRIMRLYADHTLNGLDGRTGRSVYKEGGEDHLVLSFFENFVVDQRHEWIGRIAQRLGLLQGKILAANWSYAFEERISGDARPRIADLVLHWRDNSGNAVVVVEAKRPGGMPRSGLNEKDDPRSGYYMKYSAMREMPRKQQMLLISTRDKEKLSGELRSDARVLTWEELARMQVEIFSELSPASVRPIVLERLSAHHHSLGLGQAGVRCNSSEWDMDWNASEHPDSLRDWLKGCQSFFSARELDGIPAPPFEWLNEEPRREVLLGSKRQTTRHREMPLWKVP